MAQYEKTQAVTTLCRFQCGVVEYALYQVLLSRLVVEFIALKWLTPSDKYLALVSVRRS